MNGMNKIDVSRRARSTISKTLGVNGKQVTGNARFVEDLGADSLDHVELMMALENEFGRPIPDSMLQN